jgi:hypothetical protein
MATKLVDARVERTRRPFRRIHRQRTRDQRRGIQVVDRKEIDQRERGGDLRPVEQREALLRRRAMRVSPARARPSSAESVLPSQTTSPTPNNTADRCERCEIATRSHRPLRRNDRQHVDVVGLDQCIDEYATRQNSRAPASRS